MVHTLYLSFLLHRQDFRKPNFTPKKTTKITKNTKNVSEKVIYMHFFHSFWKNLHLTENFYTDMSVVSVTNMRYGPDSIITYQFGVHQFWQFWRYCIYCYLSWYSTCFTYIDIAISPCATIICTYFDFLDIVVYLPKALLICYLFFIF